MTCGTERSLIFLDSETCGLHSMMVLLQWAEGPDGDIKLWEIWNKPVGETLEVLEWMADNIVVGFNLAFDWFHIQKIHAIWSKLPHNWIPAEHINEIAAIEDSARDCLCLKPFSALDLMLYSRRGPYQSLMARSDIRIKRVPLTPVEWEGKMIPMAYAVARYLEGHIEFDGIYFSNKKDPDAPKWNVFDREKGDGVDREFADIVLSFKPNGGLKSLAEYALGTKPQHSHDDVCLDKKHRPIELGYAPTANCISSENKDWEVWGPNDAGKEVLKGYAWPGVIQRHIDHWQYSEEARAYANDDIVYTRGLYYHFKESEEQYGEGLKHGDNDSILSCMVPSVRWKGFIVDTDAIADLKIGAEKVVVDAPINTNIPNQIREYIHQMCDETEMLHLVDTTEKRRLEEMSQWMIIEDEECKKCLLSLDPDCARCNDGVLPRGLHPAGIRAKEVLGIKIAKKEIELYDKLLKAGRFHASFKITGTLSNRMAGGDGLNAQGIKKAKEIRSSFPLKWDGYVLCGGDFDSFEVTIADAVYNDLDLRQSIVTGKKLHGIFGTLCYPGKTYEQILDSEDFPENYEFGDMYTKSKSAVFAMIYGGNAMTLHRNQGIPLDIAEKAYAEWGRMFPGIGLARQRIIDTFQPLWQPEGIGKAIFWKDPKEYVQSFLGYRRYHTLEYKIVAALFNLAQKLPKQWRDCDVPVLRSEYRGEQKAGGAVSSALYGAAFGIAEAVVRASANHEIQSPGAEITKDVQRKIWDLQPHGVHDFVVAPMNIHDEVVSVTHPDYVDREAEIVAEVVESYRVAVPLIGMKWDKDMANWGAKGLGNPKNLVHSTYDKETVLAEMESAA